MTTQAMQDWRMVEVRGDYQIYVRQEETGGWAYSLVWMAAPPSVSFQPGEQAAGAFESEQAAHDAGRAEIARRNRSAG